MKRQLFGGEYNRRDFLKISSAGAAVASGSPLSAAPSQRAGGRPNILLLMGDQHRGDCIGADGNKAISTPNIDRIAAEGARFRHAYTCTPSCTPARSALLTGLGPWRNGMLGYGRVAGRYAVELPRQLREAGYYTTGIGKMHWFNQRNRHGFHRTIVDESGREETPGFRSDYRAWFHSLAPNLDPGATGVGWNSYRAKPYVLPERLHPTAWTGNTAVNFIRGYQRPEPFLLKVSFARPHSPYDPPERFWKKYADADLPKAYVGKWAERYRKRSGSSSSIWHGDLGPEQVRDSRRGYYGSISFVDEQIGRILETLEQRGWLDQTLIIYFADHGEMTGDHYMWRKTYAYEPSARIPMVMRWPTGLVSAPRGQVLSQPTEIRDVLPTFLDAASTSAPIELDGGSLLSLVREKTSGWRQYIDLEHDTCYGSENHWSGLTDGRYKYIFYARDGEEQLFDLKNDPHELNDLGSNPASQSQVRLWRNRLIEHLAERGEEYVKNGKLALRPQRHLYSPNYPGAEKLGKS